MKIEFIKRGAATRLILIFAGWSTDARYYSDCVVEGWDTAVVSDYRDMSMPYIPSQYTTVYIFAYSLGVAAAFDHTLHAAVRVAICGSPKPASDEYGIPESVYDGTLEGLNERTLMKFHLRMAGDKSVYESIKLRLPEKTDINHLKEELVSIRNYSLEKDAYTGLAKFDRAYICEDDRIFPKEQLKAYWEGNGDTEIVYLKSSHAVDIASIIRSCLPDTKAIGEGFARAGKSYSENAIVQKEICDKICEKLRPLLSGLSSTGLSLLEIGAGSGLLTQRWRRLLTPDMATYIDLTGMPVFHAAKEERYILTDAERWLEETDEKFDIILSASTVQWFTDPVSFISTVRCHLNPGGIAILSTFVKGNLKELDAVRPSPIIYRTAEEYLSETGAEGECFERILEFPTSRDMMMHLRKTGVSQKRQNLGKVIEKGNSDHTKLWSEFPCVLTYKPLILMIKKY